MLLCLLLSSLLAAEHPGMEILIVDISKDDSTDIISELKAWQQAYPQLAPGAKPNQPKELALKVFHRGETAIPFMLALLRQSEFDRQSGLSNTGHLPRAAILWALTGSTIARNIGVSGEDTDQEAAIWQAYWAKNYTRFLVNHQPITQYWDPFTP